MHVIDTHIAEKARELLAQLPAGTRNLIARLRRDLYYGPVYVAPAEEWPFEMVEVDCWTHGSEQFDFQGACDELGDILEALPTLYYEWHSGCWTAAEPQGEWYCPETDEYTSEDPGWTDEEWEFLEPEQYYVVTGAEFKRALLGSQLSGYV